MFADVMHFYAISIQKQLIGAQMPPKKRGAIRNHKEKIYKERFDPTRKGGIPCRGSRSTRVVGRVVGCWVGNDQAK